MEGSFILDALKFLIDQGSETKIGTVLYEDDFTKLIVAPSNEEFGALMVHEVDLGLITRDHTIHSLESLIEYLTGPHATGPLGIFVGPNAVQVDLDYVTPRPDASTAHAVVKRKGPKQVLTMPLKMSKEWEAIITLSQGVSQKHLWRLLVSDLASANDKDLLATIATLKMTATSAATEKVNEVGVTMGETAETIVITMNGQDPQAVATKHIFEVRPWEGIEVKVKVETALEVDPKNVAKFFTFLPRSIDLTLLEARKDLRKQIEEGVKREDSYPYPITVIDGLMG